MNMKDYIVVQMIKLYLVFVGLAHKFGLQTGVVRFAVFSITVFLYWVVLFCRFISTQAFYKINFFKNSF